jgi:hypothetical protein
MNTVAARWLLIAITAATLAGVRPALADPEADRTPPVGVIYHLPAGLDLSGALRTAPVPTLRTTTRVALYVLQAFDAVQSGYALRGHGRYEQNGMMRPFSHGGAVTMGLGFALGDVLRGVALRRSSEGVRIGADALQGVSNIEGILATRAVMRAGPRP